MILKILNPDNGQGVPFASISGFVANGDFSGLGSVTDANGIAEIDAVRWNNLGVTNFTVSSAGFISKSFDIRDYFIDNTIELSPSYGGLGEVIVTGIIKKKGIVALVVTLIISILVGMSLKNK